MIQWRVCTSMGDLYHGLEMYVFFATWQRTCTIEGNLMNVLENGLERKKGIFVSYSALGR